MHGGGADMPNAPALSAALISVISGCIGIACSYASMRAARVRRSLLDTPTSKAQGVFIGDVEVKGTAELQKPLRSLSDRERVRVLHMVGRGALEPHRR